VEVSEDCLVGVGFAGVVEPERDIGVKRTTQRSVLARDRVGVIDVEGIVVLSYEIGK
jgi:hypothetical protein